MVFPVGGRTDRIRQSHLVSTKRIARLPSQASELEREKRRLTKGRSNTLQITAPTTGPRDSATKVNLNPMETPLAYIAFFNRITMTNRIYYDNVVLFMWYKDRRLPDPVRTVANIFLFVP